jgi:hypothetical protein
MKLPLNSNGELEIVASVTSSHTDFDFLFGRWAIHNRKLKTRLSNNQEWIEFDATAECRKILQGFGNIDQFITEFDGVLFEGASFRLFNPKTKLWSIYWADSDAVVMDVPQVGSFDGNIGRFYAEDVYAGKPIVVVFEWDKSNPENPLWSQAFSADKGQTWEWNWHMTFERQS